MSDMFGLPGSYDYDGDCGIPMGSSSTAQGSQTPVTDAGTPHGGATEIPFAGGGESNIFDGTGGGHGGFALGAGHPD